MKILVVPANPSPAVLLCCREEIPTVLPVRIVLTYQAQVGFVNERSGLQGLPCGLACHPPRSKLAQFVIDQRQQLFGGFGIISLNAVEDSRDSLMREDYPIPTDCGT